jgi:hypothetical protein
MNDLMKEHINRLNDGCRETRLYCMQKLMEAVDAGEINKPAQGDDVNNHIHTTYSFSPYSPAKAVWTAYMSGLRTAGIMDHDSISGADEFIRAGIITGIETTIGAECRVDFSNTPLKGRRINNPDQESVAYVALHGIPHTQISAVEDFFKPYQEARNLRNRKMTDRINEIVGSFGIRLDYEKDVVPLSMYGEGGSITERHLLFALSKKLVGVFGKGKALLKFLREKMGLSIRKRLEEYLADENNEHYLYDLLGVLKSDLVPAFYIDAGDECPDVSFFIEFSQRIGAISAYAYLGDVGESVTGDKKAQKFEDEYIEELFEVLKGLGFNAVTYMPSRNTSQQLEIVRSFCERYGFFQISGEDINQPRQSFVCEALRKPEFRNLIRSTWALIGHEKAATRDLSQSMFSKETEARYPVLEERIEKYSMMGKQL